MSAEEKHMDDAILLKFLLGEAGPDEKRAITEWLQQSPSHQQQLDTLEKLWLETGNLKPRPIVVDSRRAWEQLSAKISVHETEQTPIRTLITKKRQQWIRSFAAAASLLLLAGVIYFLFDLSHSKQEILFSNNSPDTLENILPDGSRIVLNSKAEIAYSKAYTSATRAVKLKGEAFFDVAKDSLHPFVIDAGIGHIRVLGTQFNVNRKANEDILVDVMEGKVSLLYPRHIQSDTLQLILTAGQSGHISRAADSLFLSEPHPAAFYWMNGSLIFKNKALEEVFQILENTHGINIQVEDPKIKSLILSSRFSDEDAENVIRVIAATFNLSYQKIDHQYIISRNLQDE